MRINELFNSKELVFSFEIFPPKVTSPIDTIYNTLEELKDLKPDFISVTYGAGGSLKNNRTTELSSLVKEKYGVESVAHLTCISSTKDEIDVVLDDLKNHGIENILALRGDIPAGQDAKGEFNYAHELISYIKNRGEFNILGACYPEGHVKGRNFKEDMLHLKLKEEMGATHFISQLFLDNNYFYNMLEEKEKLGIKAPIQAGIMPVINKNQIHRISTLCGANIPEKFIKIMNKYEHDKDALREAGIAYAVEQIVDLVSSGVDGIHLYTMNNPYVARRIHDNINIIINSINNKKMLKYKEYMEDKAMDKVESFELDHRKVKAPYIRKCCLLNGPKGDVVTKFDIRFLQPNKEAFGTAAMHGLEHLLAYELRKNLEGIIDLSPMGCRTGFYLSVFGNREATEIKIVVENALNVILKATEIPAANDKQCGNYRDLSLFGAKEYAREALEKGFSLEIYE